MELIVCVCVCVRDPLKRVHNAAFSSPRLPWLPSGIFKRHRLLMGAGPTSKCGQRVNQRLKECQQIFIFV